MWPFKMISKFQWNWYDAYYGVNITTCKDNNYTNFIRQMSDPSMPDSSIGQFVLIALA